MLGPLHVVSLADARELAARCRTTLFESVHPIEARRERIARSAVTAIVNTSHFGACLRQSSVDVRQICRNSTTSARNSGGQLVCIGCRWSKAFRPLRYRDRDGSPGYSAESAAS